MNNDRQPKKLIDQYFGSISIITPRTDAEEIIRDEQSYQPELETIKSRRKKGNKRLNIIQLANDQMIRQITQNYYK